MRTKAAEGADVRVMRPRAGFGDAIPALSGVGRNYPVRLLEETRIFLAVLDDLAGIGFPTADGKADMATMLLVGDPPGMPVGGGALPPLLGPGPGMARASDIASLMEDLRVGKAT